MLMIRAKSAFSASKSIEMVADLNSIWESYWVIIYSSSLC